ncbi:class I SAM-dependent methyltransferase [Planomonospora sp. ID67723]|uniref:class I SAM-dependent methyltransferase n=1 Tax=Planomonospora sp. ID67723 TaxID=2738134 RepID=UPI0018C3C41D|nr:class I SAM-dependent methyltransferase [Planomonospora sp. ID67723]MBG0831717.1 class I SAM-dependent methyltransferase [Planomonospora sp. ID67723]
MDLGFRGEVADLYHRYRRGYPPAVIDSLVESFGLTGDDTVVDLGCGTGQLALPIARQVRAVVGLDPEPDMLLRARRAADEQGVANVSWMIGADTDTPTLGRLLGDGTVGAVTIGQALHWMDHDRLFHTLAPLVRPGGGVAVLANGTPLWQQDTAWSRALRDVLEQWCGRKLTRTCGTDEESRRRYGTSLAAAGFEVHETGVDYTDELDLDRIVGSVYSALPVDELPAPDRRPSFAEQVRCALEPYAPFTEHVRVATLIGRTHAATS